MVVDVRASYKARQVVAMASYRYYKWLFADIFENVHGKLQPCWSIKIWSDTNVYQKMKIMSWL